MASNILRIVEAIFFVPPFPRLVIFFFLCAGPSALTKFQWGEALWRLGTWIFFFLGESHGTTCFFTQIP